MSAISLKSITGITSITTPAGVDNQLTLHTNNTTERVKIDVAGNVHVNNHLNITGVTTANQLKFGDSNGSTTNIAKFGASDDLVIYHNGNHSKIIDMGTGNLYLESDVGSIYLRVSDNEQGVTIHQNGDVELYHDNVKKAYTENNGFYITDTGKAAMARVLAPAGYDARIDLTADTHGNEDNYRIEANTDQKFRVYGKPGGNYTSFIELDQVGKVTLTRDVDVARHLDVDGHTELDNVNIVGVTTHNGGTNLYGNGGASVVWGNTGYTGHLSYDGSSNAVIRAASGKALIFQTNHVNERIRITSSGEMGVNTTAPVEKLGISGNMRFVNPNGTTSRITALPSGTYSTGTSGGAAVCFQRTADGAGGSDEIFFETHWQGNRHGESCRINKYGNLKFPSGQGIDFSSQTNEGSTSQNALLADYEEGVWTPTNSIGMTLTNNNTAHYIKIGKQVTVWFDLTLTGNPDSAQCSMIQSLPYVSKQSNTYYGQSNSVWYSNTGDAKKDYDDDNTLIFVNNNDTNIYIWNVTSGHSRVRSWGNNRRFRGTITYLAKN